jgi:carbon monoxide dehydrogenase subunit G
MTTLERSIEINAGPAAIDAVALNGNRLSEWYTGMQETKADAVYPEVGGTVEATYRAAGINFKMKITSVELVRGHSITLKMDGMITGTNRWVYSPAGEATRVTATLDYEMPGGSLGQAVNKLIVEKMNAENLEKSLNNLKAVVEGR